MYELKDVIKTIIKDFKCPELTIKDYNNLNKLLKKVTIKTIRPLPEYDTLVCMEGDYYYLIDSRAVYTILLLFLL